MVRYVSMDPSWLWDSWDQRMSVRLAFASPAAAHSSKMRPLPSVHGVLSPEVCVSWHGMEPLEIRCGFSLWIFVAGFNGLIMGFNTFFYGYFSNFIVIWGVTWDFSRVFHLWEEEDPEQPMIWDILWVYRFIISFLSLVNQFRDKARFPNLDIGKQPSAHLEKYRNITKKYLEYYPPVN